MHYWLWNYWCVAANVDLRGTLIISYSGVGSAYHLSQAIADGKLGEDKPFTAVIVEARDFCKFFGPHFICVFGLINIGK